MIYVCLAALKRGWIDGCRNIVGLDGCFIKNFHKGQLLTTVGVDPNNQMYVGKIELKLAAEEKKIKIILKLKHRNPIS